MFMGVAGTMMAGRLGEASLAASGVAGVVYVLSMLLVWGSIRMVPTPIAEAHELKDGPRARTLIFAGLLMGGMLLLVCTLVLWLGLSNFNVLGQDPEVANMAVGYLKIILFNLPVLILFALLVNFMDAFTYVRLTMFLSFGGMLLDVSLNWLFMFGKFGLPAMGINAIALNTGITHAAMCIVLLWVLLRRAELRYIRIARSNWPDIWRQTLLFLRHGIPSAFQLAIEFAAFGAGTVIVGQIGKTEQAAHQIAMNLISVTYVTILGVSTAGMIRIGQALAYRSNIRIWLAGVATISLAAGIMLIPTLAFLLFPGAIVQWYIADPQVAGIAATLVFMAGLFQLADALQASSISLLRALNDTQIPALVSFVSFWLIGLPLGYWLAVYQHWNAVGIWLGYLVGLIVQAVLLMRRFFILVRNGRFLADRPEIQNG